MRFDVEVVPFPELQIATEGALCDNLEQFTFSAINCNDVNFDAVTEPCVDCPVTTCESVSAKPPPSPTGSIRSWRVFVCGVVLPQPRLGREVVSIDAATLTSGLNPIYLLVTANTSSPNNPILPCETIDTVSFNWHEAPTLDALTLPDYLCPGSEYMLEAEAENANGSEEQLCFLWRNALKTARSIGTSRGLLASTTTAALPKVKACAIPKPPSRCHWTWSLASTFASI